MSVVINGDTITWDGDTTGLTSVEGILFRVSDAIVTKADLTQGYTIITYDSYSDKTETAQLPNDAFAVEEDGTGVALYVTDPSSGFPVVICVGEGDSQEPGVYFLDGSSVGLNVRVTSLTIPGYNFNPVKLIDAFIVRRGGGGTGKLFAAIGVTYPEGSTLTCTNGTKTLTAKTTSGQWVFAIPETGTWTVTATNGRSTKSQSVSITTEGQWESVVLSYALMLFDGGDNTAVTGGWGIKGHNVPNISKITVGNELYITITGTSGANYKVWPIYPMNTIDLSGHSTMKVNVKSLSSINKVFSLAILTDIEINQSFASGDPLAQAYITGTGEFSLDISKITGKCYPCIVGELNGGGASANLTATKVWLE